MSVPLESFPDELEKVDAPVAFTSNCDLQSAPSSEVERKDDLEYDPSSEVDRKDGLANSTLHRKLQERKTD